MLAYRATAQTEKSAGAKCRAQQAGHADGIDGRHHDVEHAGNEEGAAVLRQGREPKAQHDEKGHEANCVDRCQLATARDTVAKEKPDQQDDKQKKDRGRK